MLNDASTSTSVLKLTTNSTPSGAPPDTFDLAKFTVAVLGTAQWDIKFVGSLFEGSLQATEHSVRMVDAEADVLSGGLGSSVLRHLDFHDSDDTTFIFDARTGVAATSHIGPISIAPVAVSTHYDGLHVG